MQIQLAMIRLVLIAAAVAAAGCQGRLAYNLPPSSRLMEPGPGVDGPGPGVIPVSGGMTVSSGMGGMQAGGYGNAMPMGGGGVYPCSYQCDAGCMDGGGGGYGAYAAGMGASSTSQISFLGEAGIQVQWDVGGTGQFDSMPLVVPGRQDFPQAAIYRLRISNIPGRPGVRLYPTLEVAPVTPRTDAYLAHAPIPVQFTEEDFDQVQSGNFVTKVIYLPDPEFQELALAGVETLVSTRLDPGCDPIAEADRRGSILAILRIGSKDLEGAGGRFTTDGSVLPAQYERFEGEAAAGVLQQPNTVEADMPDGSYQGNYQGNYQGEDQGNYQGEYQGNYNGNMYNGNMYGGEISDGQFSGGQIPGGHVLEGNNYGGAIPNSTDNYYPSQSMPVGMPTAGFAPPAVPPHMIPGMGPQWGMPISGTPIGLPGPPHIPLGKPAGLQKHVMKNRTRVALPPPTDSMRITVKQRPGLNYPKPVQRVSVDETVRQPINCFNGGFPGHVNPHLNDTNCEDNYCR